MTSDAHDANASGAPDLFVQGVVVGPLQCNCWIVGNRMTGQAVCIDPGGEPERVLEAARNLGVEISLILATHAHFDHVWGVRGVQAQTHAPFLLHGDDVSLLERGWQGIAARFGLETDEAPPEPDRTLEDGQLLEIDGLSLRAIHTPGHTPGSTSYHIALDGGEEGVVFTGDTLFQGSIGRTDFPGGDFEQEMRSIAERLLVLPDATAVLPGHMGDSTIGRERTSNPWVVQWLAGRGG